VTPGGGWRRAQRQVKQISSNVTSFTVMVHCRGLRGTDFLNPLPPSPAGFLSDSHPQPQKLVPNPTAVPQCHFRRMWRNSLASHGTSNCAPYSQYQMRKNNLRNRLNYQRCLHGPYIVLLGYISQYARCSLRRAELEKLALSLELFYSLPFRSRKIFRWRNMGDQYLGLFLGNVVNYSLIIGLFRK
jgi:hypothetical protein